MRRFASRLRSKFVDAPESVGARQRSQRWQLFDEIFPGVGQMSVIDLGGTVESWLRAPVRPAAVTVVNLFEPGEAGGNDWLRPITGDACNARESLHGAGHEPTEFDLVFSNSLLEHVGGHAQRIAMAREVAALAPRHWIQTPYRYFPIEPHWLFPGLQFLPMGLRSKIAAKWPLAHSSPADAEAAMSEVQWTELIGRSELASYFPDSVILAEKIAGLTKSIIAVKA